MFGSKKKSEPVDNPMAAEPRPFGVRISELSEEDRLIIARDRFEKIDKHLKLAGCKTIPSPSDFAINFHTGDHLMIVQVDRIDPKRISIAMVFSQKEGDVRRARWASFEATAKQFASKSTVVKAGHGYMVTMSVGVYAESLHSFGDALKSYVEDIIKLYNDFIDLMIIDG